MRRPILFGLLPVMVGAPILFGAFLQFGDWEEHRGLQPAVQRLAPSQPRMISLSGQLDVGFPLVRRVGGVWVGRPHSLWLTIASLTLIGARMTRVAAGEVDIELPFDPRLTQQHGFMHAGIIGTALDSACGFASLTLMPADAGILTIEYKVNLLSPGRGVRLRVTGRVRKAGRTITLAEGDAIAIAADGTEKLVATMTATEMTIIGRDEVKG
jgi:uncharacterized protein (TIGR00369 family)